MTRKTMTIEEVRVRKTALKMELDELNRIESEILGGSLWVKPGDIVRRTFGAMKDAKFVVAHIQHMHCSKTDKPWVAGYLIKKDGTPGLVLKHLYYEWEKVEDGTLSER